ncbi:DNA polymerase III, delta subunit [Rubrimonas cliftonensis]|uniref:DNA-directed DNA polymerase n=2 Tax=Rubrimonas cliftonensis TaxID=89524 RepID=A0A1H4EDF3_9RHOB|nr:DNA polymerase III subunit delta [Rubrimonas cliftonensis]SEA83063.1 DNA polymerase III, delta subunit [Rubrimonas cliftonensis]
MRLDVLQAQGLRSDPAALDAALRAQGFFPGRRAVVVNETGDQHAETVAAALAATGPEAFLLITAGVLPSRSSLRKLFEAGEGRVAAAFYPDPPDRGALRDMLRSVGVAGGADDAALSALESVAHGMDRGSLARLVEVVSLHHSGADRPVDLATVEACAPPSSDDGMGGAAEAAVEAALSGKAARVRAELARLTARGASPVSVALASARRLRQLHALAVGGAPKAAALARLRAPDAADRAQALARHWGAARLEQGLRLMLETDAGLRGGSAAPEHALMERALLRLAAMAG